MWEAPLYGVVPIPCSGVEAPADTCSGRLGRSLEAPHCRVHQTAVDSPRRCTPSGPERGPSVDNLWTQKPTGMCLPVGVPQGDLQEHKTAVESKILEGCGRLEREHVQGAPAVQMSLSWRSGTEPWNTHCNLQASPDPPGSAKKHDILDFWANIFTVCGYVCLCRYSHGKYVCWFAPSPLVRCSGADKFCSLYLFSRHLTVGYQTSLQQHQNLLV